MLRVLNLCASHIFPFIFYLGVRPTRNQLRSRAITARLLATTQEQFENLRLLDLKGICAEIGISKSVRIPAFLVIESWDLGLCFI